MEIPEPKPDDSTKPLFGQGKSKYIVLIGLTIYCTVIWNFGLRDIRDQLLDADITKIAIATIIIFTATWLRILKWRYALGPGQHALGLFIMSKATGDLTPGRLGEFAPMVIKNHRTAKIGAWIMFDRIIEILATITLGLYGLVTINLLSQNQLTLVFIATAIATIMGIYFITHRSIFLWMAKKVRDGSLLHRLFTILAAINLEIFMFMRSLPFISLITIVTKAMDLFAVMTIFQALGAFPSFGLTAASKCALAIVGFVPITPTATGVPHSTQFWLMNTIGDIPGEALVVGIGIEVIIVSVTFWTSTALVIRFVRDAALAGKDLKP
jgi:hypothetical protein